QLIPVSELLAPDFSGEDVMAMTVLHNRRAVHDNGFHPRGMSLDFLSVNDVRQLLADQIVDLVGVEDRHIRGHSFFQQAAIEAKSLCREAGELVDRLLEVEEIFFAAPITKNFCRSAVPEETIQVRADVCSNEARLGLDHLPEKLRVRVG